MRVACQMVAEQGVSVLFTKCDTATVCGLADRIIVPRRGLMIAERPPGARVTIQPVGRMRSWMDEWRLV